MRPTLVTRLVRTMVYQAPHHTAPEPSVLESLVSKSHWRRVQIQRDPSEFKECCGTSTSSQAQVSANGPEVLSKDYKFRNFREAFAWMTKVAEKAEELKHHPEWSNVSVNLYISAVVVHRSYSNRVVLS